MKMNRALTLVALSLLAVTSWVQAQNGEPRATVPTVVKVDYDTAAFMAPLPLTETQAKGRTRFAQRCANCHGGNNQQLGPLLGRETVDRLGDAGVRDKVQKGSMLMPGFQYALGATEIDQIVAFLKTYTPPRRQQAAPAPSS